MLMNFHFHLIIMMAYEIYYHHLTADLSTSCNDFGTSCNAFYCLCHLQQEGPHLLEILCRNVSEDHFLFIEHLRNINLLHTLVNSHTLNLYTIEAVIAKMRENFLKLHQKFKMSETLKLHVIFSHYLEYFHDRAHTLEIHRRGYRSCSQPAKNV